MRDIREAVSEERTIWERLKSENKPVIIYGTGNGADKAFEFCERFGIKIAGVAASGEFARGGIFRGFKVAPVEEAAAKKDGFTILLAFGTNKPEVIGRIMEISRETELLAPDLPLFGNETVDFDFLANHNEELVAVHRSLADEKSRAVFRGVLNFKLSGKIDRLSEIESDAGEKREIFFGGKKDYLYIDGGAYTGDTLADAPCLAENAGKIVAIEPDAANFSKLRETVKARGLTDKCELINRALWSVCGSIGFSSEGSRNSSLFGEKSGRTGTCTLDLLVAEQLKKRKFEDALIKLDVEGAEKEALLGGISALRRVKSRLLISLYHKNEDLYQIPALIKKTGLGYRLFLRKHRYIPCWDLNLIALPHDGGKGKE